MVGGEHEGRGATGDYRDVGGDNSAPPTSRKRPVLSIVRARPRHNRNYFLQNLPPPRETTLSGTERHNRNYFLQDLPPPRANTLSRTECQPRN